MKNERTDRELTGNELNTVHAGYALDQTTPLPWGDRIILVPEKGPEAGQGDVRPVDDPEGGLTRG